MLVCRVQKEAAAMARIKKLWIPCKDERKEGKKNIQKRKGKTHYFIHLRVIPTDIYKL